MCIAEALLRVPDDATQERLIRDKLSAADWDRHIGRSPSLFVNASTWALMLTGRLIRLRDYEGQSAGAAVRRLVARLGEPVVREAVNYAMRIMGRQFVMGRTIEDALDNARALESRGYRYSYDMLGEAARTRQAAAGYFEAYKHAIAAIGRRSSSGGVADRPGISVKLSALHPRYEMGQAERLQEELLPLVLALARHAASAGIGLTIDAEEAERLDLSLDVVEAVAADPQLEDWNGLGVVVQAYQKAAPFVIDWLADLAQRHRRRLMVRLVKGAYWDAEIKRSQELGLPGYPVFTRKPSTDVSYLACARRLLNQPAQFYPQFATHNAHSIAAVLEFAGDARDFEFQRLHGMGETLYEELVENHPVGVACRIYAPVGQHEDLLAYLVRRLLENGANSSFVNRIQDDHLPIEEIVADPIATVRALARVPHSRIPVPREMYLPERLNSRGIDLADRSTLAELTRAMNEADGGAWEAGPIIGAEERLNGAREAVSPADRTRPVGRVAEASEADVERALAVASGAAATWAATPVDERARCLDRAADLMEANMPALMTLAVREAGKTINDAVAEVREAADFCRYYAHRAREDLGRPLILPISVGGMGRVELTGGGVFACISPWNFPLAIFTGQIAAALVAGNAVVAKPAEQTALMAAEGVRLLHRAGIPADVLHLLPGDGTAIGGAIVADPRVFGIVFTGSTEVALSINRTLAKRARGHPPLIAETGGQNAMIVDSTALPEQVVRDAVVSAFQSAGQRCSALRVLFVQEDIAGRIIDMLAGAMDELRVGDPALLATDVGPVIDEEAQAMLEGHIKRMRSDGRLIARARLGSGTDRGTFVAPVAFEIDRLSLLQREVFGPVLHVIRYPADRLPQVIEAVNDTGYGLTLGIQTRIDATWRFIFDRVRIGNTYVNRNQIGAAVGVQPFGGQGRSGTGPKAGGPHYLHRFVASRPANGHAAVSVRAAPWAVAPPTLADIRFNPSSLNQAFSAAEAAQSSWALTSDERRADWLERAAAALEASPEAVAGTGDSGAASADAAEYLRFCAVQLRSTLAPQPLPGPTGERNELSFQPRGVIACLCMGNPDLASFARQIAASLACGNVVLAWHPEPERAARVASLLADAGMPSGVLHILQMNGSVRLSEFLSDPRLAGVSFSGPPEVASEIGRVIAQTDASIVPLVIHDERLGAGIGLPPCGSPHYLSRFVFERTLTIDTTSSGGNASLLSLGAEP
jgi:RHH-type transcriptional regulator, proline utilization regulon repressor / proline dehydrogenase / delta 1-pyrroline-5-carboxylate dehydrogenase